MQCEGVYRDAHPLFRSSVTEGAPADKQKRHLGSALNVRYGTWRFGAPRSSGDTKRMDASDVYQALQQSAHVKRGLASTLRWRNRVRDSKLDDKRSPVKIYPSYSDLGLFDVGPQEEAAIYMEAIKRGLAAALQSKYRWKSRNQLSGKRSLASAMQSAWRRKQSQALPTRRKKRSTYVSWEPLLSIN